MKLRNIMLVASDLERSKQFYTELFGLSVITDADKNAILTEGLVLQDKSVWEEFMGREVVGRHNLSEIYFETENMEVFMERLYSLYPDITIVTPLYEYLWGKKIVRFYDPDGNLIEVGTPEPKIQSIFRLKN